MKARTFHIILCIAIISFLFFDSFARIEVAVTKNQFLINTKKGEIEGIKDLSVLKKYAKEQLDRQTKERRKESNMALIKVGCILLLFFSMLQLIATPRYKPVSKDL